MINIFLVMIVSLKLMEKHLTVILKEDQFAYLFSNQVKKFH